ncbi:hypothetical protein ACQSSU_23765 [Micromonospora echinospora]
MLAGRKAKRAPALRNAPVHEQMIMSAALLRALRDGTDEVHVDPDVAVRARASVQRMIEIGTPGGGE